MEEKDFRALLDTKEYEFLKTNPRLGTESCCLVWVEAMLMGQTAEPAILTFGGSL